MFSKAHRFSFKSKLPKHILNFPSFTLRFEKNDESLKAGVVVSKKVDKRAVVRNSIKRKILETVGEKIDENSGWNIVFYAKKQAADLENLSKEVEEALGQIN